MPLPIVKQVNDLVWYFQRRRERRWLRRGVGQWGRERAAGRSRFVWRHALGWGMPVALAWASWHYVTDGYLSPIVTLLSIPVCVALGWWEAAVEWARRERLYEQALREGITDIECHEIKRSKSSEA